MFVLESNLRWIARHFKAFSAQPVIVSESPLGIDAWYDWNFHDMVVIDNQEIYNQKGLIVISSDAMYPIETLILHEYRHHLQVALNGQWRVPDYSNGEPLDDYNNDCVFEKDARLFEVALGGIDEFTDGFDTPTLSRSFMLSLPTPEFLARVD